MPPSDPSSTSHASPLEPASDREAEAIFVVGVSRSGTTLMRRLLETSDRIGIAGENHFLGHHLAREGARHYFRKLGDLNDDRTVRRLVEFIYSGEYARRSLWREPSHFWTWLRQNVPPAGTIGIEPTSKMPRNGPNGVFFER